MKSFANSDSEVKPQRGKYSGKPQRAPSRFIRECPPEERPQERLITAGPEVLSNAELIAVIIRSGSTSQSVLDLSKQVLDIYDQNLALFRNADVEELANNSELKGLGIVKAVQLVAAIELGRRIFEQNLSDSDVNLSSSFSAGQYLVKRLRFEQQEKFCALLLNHHNDLIAFKEITSGTMTSSLVHPREVFIPAVRSHAAKMILGHNHRATRSGVKSAGIREGLQSAA